MGKAALVFFAAFSFSAFAQDVESLPVEYFDLQAPQIREIETAVQPAEILESQCDRGAFFSPLELSWDDIVNIGAQVWKIIVDNQPVLHSEAPVAHALPKGLKCWTELERWSPPATKTYEVLYENGFGMDVVKFRFRVQYTSGGQLRGRGRYLANTTILNSQTDVMWGYTFNSYVEVPKTINLGSSRDPVAGLEMNLHWNVKTRLKESDNSVHFFVDGNGGIQMNQ